MCENIRSVTIRDKEQMEIIFSYLKELFDEKLTTLASLDMISDKSLYYYVKSHRSNVTEGNTTNVGEFTEIVSHRISGDKEFVVPSKPAGETYEIDNLVKAFEYLEDASKYNLKTLLSIHRILGNNIIKSNLNFYKGKLKPGNNFVPFMYNELKYKKFFIEARDVKSELDKLFNLWNNLEENSPSSVFAKYIILQIELIAIHPFVDGNGRVSRAMSESYIESFNFIPYTPYSTDYKQEYQNMMARYSIEALTDLKSAYGIIATYFLNGYSENVSDLTEAVNKLSKSIQ